MLVQDDRVDRIASSMQLLLPRRPAVAIILGTGLGELVNSLSEVVEISFSELSDFPRATALGHRGRFVFGHLDEIPVIAMDGRLHFYEGHSFIDVVIGVRVMHRLGAQSLIVTNASGGLNPRLASGDILILNAHVNLMGKRSMGWFTDRKFNSMNTAVVVGAGRSVYDPRMVDLAMTAARIHNVRAAAGTYVAVSGPNYETRAEYRFLRRIGGDAVGMSTVPEVITAAMLRLRVLGLSVVTNVANPDAPRSTSGQEVIDLAHLASTKLQSIVRFVVAGI